MQGQRLQGQAVAGSGAAADGAGAGVARQADAGAGSGEQKAHREAAGSRAGPAAVRSGQACGGRLGQAVASARSSVRLRVLLGSTGMPGPIVVVKVTFFTYRPLAAAGLSLITSSRAAA